MNPIIIRGILFLVMIIVFSCEKSDLFISCDDCTPNEPAEVTIHVKYDFSNYYYNKTIIRVYQGNLEDSLLVRELYNPFGAVEISVFVNIKYTLTATYFEDGRKYTAVDTANPMVRFESKRCVLDCYYAYNNNADLRIRYTK
jgi:hypothetical protein